MALCVLGPGVRAHRGYAAAQHGPGRYGEATQKENLLLKSRGEGLSEKKLEMGKIMDGFEEIVYQAVEAAQKQKALTKS